MSGDDQAPLFEVPRAELPPDPLPRIPFGDRQCSVYVASPLTRLKQASPEARLVESDLDTIKEAIKSLDLDGGLSVSIEAYVPIEHSSAHRHGDLTPEEVFKRNSLQVLTNSDGLIVYGCEPGAGVGQEFTWAATQVAIPVLWLHHHELPVSRQVSGTPGDITVKPYDKPPDLRREVQDWVRSRRAVLAAGPFRRATREQRWRGPTAAAHARWARLVGEERRRVCATLHVTPDVVEFYLSNPLLLASAPHWLIDQLTAEGLLVVRSTATSRPLGRLETQQLMTLAEASREYEWNAHVVDFLRTSAEQLLAEPATRRFKLETPADWARLYDSLRP